MVHSSIAYLLVFMNNTDQLVQKYQIQIQFMWQCWNQCNRCSIDTQQNLRFCSARPACAHRALDQTFNGTWSMNDTPIRRRFTWMYCKLDHTWKYTAKNNPEFLRETQKLGRQRFPVKWRLAWHHRPSCTVISATDYSTTWGILYNDFF